MKELDPEKVFRHEQLQCSSCNELIGLCKGIIADNTINQQEAEFLIAWLDAHQDTAETFPGSVLAARLAGMLHDHHLDTEEAAELIALLKDLTGGAGQGTASATGSPAIPYDDPQPQLTFTGQHFCLTGPFLAGKRATIAHKLAETGAYIEQGLTADMPCCLIVGGLISQAWVSSKHGHLLLAAVKARAPHTHGAPVSIVSEDHLWSELLRQGYA